MAQRCTDFGCHGVKSCHCWILSRSSVPQPKRFCPPAKVLCFWRIPWDSHSEHHLERVFNGTNMNHSFDWLSSRFLGKQFCELPLLLHLELASPFKKCCLRQELDRFGLAFMEMSEKLEKVPKELRKCHEQSNKVLIRQPWKTFS